jgi:Tol biopolymer transport system component
MDKNGGSLRQVTSVGQYSRAPVWSPDGKWIGFVSDAAKSAGGAYGDFFVVSLETGEVKQVTDTNGQIYEWRVSWTE